MSLSDRELIELHDRISRMTFDDRLGQSDLMRYVFERFGRGTQDAIRAQTNTHIYFMWCMRRAVMSYTYETEYFQIMQQIWDIRFRQFCCDLAGGDQSRGDVLEARLRGILAQFDEAVADESSADSWVPALGRAVLSFISSGRPDADRAREMLMVVGGPAKAFNKAHEIVRPFLAQSIGIRE